MVELMTTSQASLGAGRTSPPRAARNADEDASGPIGALKRFHASMMDKSRVYALLADIVLAIREHEPDLLAKQAAYSLLYAVPSILVFLISIAAIVDKNTGAGVSAALQRTISEQAPDQLQPLLQSLVQRALVETSENTAIVATIISLAIALWSATGGVGAQIYAINTVYGIKDRRSFIKQAIVKIGLMLLGGVMIVAAFILLAFGRRILEWVPGISAEGGPLAGFLSSSIIWAMLLLLVALMMLYWFGLDAPKSFRWLLPGAVAATVAVGLVVGLLDLILSYSNPGAAYGAAGSVLILLWTFYVLSAIVVVGAIINAVLGRRYDRKLIAGLQSRRPELPARKRIELSVYR
jgi:membrane protein